MILMWFFPGHGNMPKYYPGLREILPVDLGNILAYYLDRPHYYMNIKCTALQISKASLFCDETSSILRHLYLYCIVVSTNKER